MKNRLRFLGLILMVGTAVLVGCTGGDDHGESQDTQTAPPAPVTTQALSGGGVKGPLARAIVRGYAFDFAAADFKGAVVGEGSTNDGAAIINFAVPLNVVTPFLLELTSDANTIDITTGAAPIITTMRTVVTAEMLGAGRPLYATPLTTMAMATRSSMSMIIAR